MPDPLHQRILQRLAGELDPQVFEDCACDLLREIWPGLFPVRGGQDGGMDGAIADGEGEAFPLVGTTSHQVLRNFKKSLDSYIRSGGRQRKVALATSRELNRKRRVALETAAGERDFTLVQIVDRRGMAELLYKSSRWRRELGIPGNPPALSVFPLSPRPLPELKPLGREDDLDWLRSTSGDRVLSGEPGAGKSFLIAHLIRTGWNGLFLASRDRTEIADAVREQAPGVVVVDDAHVEPELLQELRHLRQDIGARFDLLAVTWGGQCPCVVEALGPVPEEKIHLLPLLPRHQILEIYKQAGVQGDEDLLRELVDQAGNKPALAATIAHLWKQGAWQEVLSGEALHRSVIQTFHRLVGSEAEDLLAAFSLGGDRGMDAEVVRSFLGLNRLELRQKTAGLAFGGVLSEEQEGRALSVWPRQLRAPLLRTIFFSPGSPDFEPLLEHAPDFERAVAELILVRQRGVHVPELRELVTKADSSKLWSQLALVDEEEARWVLTNSGQDLLVIAEPLLQRIPSEVIPLLLKRDAALRRTREKEQGIAFLASWLRSKPLNEEEPLSRRWLLARAGARYLRSGGDLGVGVQAIFKSLSPTQSWNRLDPGLGTTVTLYTQLLPLRDLQEIEQLWQEVGGAIPALDREAWQHIRAALWDWMHPTSAARGRALSPGVTEAMPAFAVRVLRDLSPLAADSPGWRAGIHRLASALPGGIELPLDPVFELLYPAGVSQEQRALEGDIRQLAQDWQSAEPEEELTRLAFYEAEADKIGYSWPRGSQILCRALAEMVTDLGTWLQAAVDRGLNGLLVEPFLERFTLERHPGWELTIESCLRLEGLRSEAIKVALTMHEAPPRLVQEALNLAVEWPYLVEITALQMPTESLRAALHHPSWPIALAAAVGAWDLDRGLLVAEELRDDWKTAILKAQVDDTNTGPQTWLGDILAQDADLACEWLVRRLRQKEMGLYFLGGPETQAVQALRPEHRARLLAELPPEAVVPGLLPHLIAGELDLYRQLLAMPTLKDFHLEPLRRRPDGSWIPLAIAALGAGYPMREIVTAAASTPDSGWSGELAELWQELDQAFAALEDHSLENVREIGRQGRRRAAEEIARLQVRERTHALKGI